ncbi:MULTISPECIES: hypothetical protein [Prosthecochloris]|uniref:Uncharacterized protein n=1 Tax=Prosthecochloris vibrioformis TaxID=1098 RepID=A0A5C4S2F9_PROVB|nr:MULTISPECIES: hypothetical protein [Prosthecochloris]ANT66008.1 hypothetical protein Ptc2401_02284 [Prosthecochloris sp. CIB 2401]TNJ37670.1 hypothetical protein FGF68_00335 [Prosthecochloris vibrioformis]
MDNERTGGGRLGLLLRPRIFLYLVVITGLLLLYINNILRINDLSGESESLKEKIAVQQSINASLLLQLQELESIQSIGGKAEEAGLLQSVLPAIYITY